jgi:hypothetical protein
MGFSPAHVRRKPVWRNWSLFRASPPRSRWAHRLRGFDIGNHLRKDSLKFDDGRAVLMEFLVELHQLETTA